MTTYSNRKLFSNFIALGIVQGTNFLLPLIVMPFVISKIGADGFGIVAIAQVVMIYLAAISDYGFNLTATRDIALFANEPVMLSKLFFTVLGVKMILCSGIFLLMLITILSVPSFHSLFSIYIPGFIYVLGQSLFVNWFFQGKEKMHYITFSTLVSRIIFVVLVFLFIHEKEDAAYFVFFLGLGNLVAGIISIIIAIRIFKLSFILPSRKDIMYELRGGWQVTLSNVSINTYFYSGIFFLRLFTSNSIVGYYAVAERIFFAARQVLSVFSQVIYPGLCKVSREGKQATIEFLHKIYRPFLVLIITGSICLFIFSPLVIRIFIKEETGQAVTLLRMLSVVPVVVCLNIPAYQLLLAFDRKKSYSRVLLSATVLNILLNLLLANMFAARGTAMTIIITETIITVWLNLELFKNKLNGYTRPGKYE